MGYEFISLGKMMDFIKKGDDAATALEKAKGPRYLEMAEGYVTRIALNKDDEIIGYEFINLGKMMDAIKKGTDANEAMEAAKGHYGQFDAAAKYIDPRHE